MRRTSRRRLRARGYYNIPYETVNYRRAAFEDAVAVLRGVDHALDIECIYTIDSYFSNMHYALLKERAAWVKEVKDLAR